MTQVMENENAGTGETNVIRPVAHDSFRWNVKATVEKFTAEQEAEVLARIEAEHGADIDERFRKTLLTQGLQEFEPYDVVVVEGNLLTRLGRKRLIDRLVETASVNGLTSARARIGVGNGTTAAADTDTDLAAAAGAGNRQFELVDSSPSVSSGASSGAVTFVATFETGDANFAWEEWGVDGGTADGTTVTSEAAATPGLINRRVAALGTKTSAAAWVFTVVITIT